MKNPTYKVGGKTFTIDLSQFTKEEREILSKAKPPSEMSMAELKAYMRDKDNHSADFDIAYQIMAGQKPDFVSAEDEKRGR